jgi:NADH dehydrogenase FAD-containing subunit
VNTNDLFEIAYDKLVIAVGVKTNTFGIESIKEAVLKGEGVFFLKRLAHARAIRTNIIACFEKAALPHIPDAERRRLLSFVVVGGGPTSCEFTAELHGAFSHEPAFGDWLKIHPHRYPHILDCTFRLCQK